MTPERWARVGEILDRAVEADPAERPALVTRLAGGDAALRDEVLAFLDADDRAGETFERPLTLSVGDASTEPARDRAGTRLGAYRLVRRIDAGGMGVVYEAERADQAFEKRVAVKLLRHGPDDPESRRRFGREIRILASLEHPNVARLIDGGVSDAGEPYLVLEYVEGVPIDEWSDSRGLSVRERIELFLDVCAAVQYAHSNLVVHRDLKPANVLVTAEGTVKLLDFGVAKLLGEEEAAATVTGTARPFTPAYASPEQLSGASVSIASDVYALGILLWELLAGRRPFPDDPSPVALARRVDAEPPPPSRPAAEAGRDVPGDLDRIVGKAMRPEPDRRYSTVDRLAEDLRAWLGGRPVSARPDSPAYRARKFVGRHRPAVAAGVVALLALLGGIAATTWQAREAAAEARRAESQRARAETVSSFLQRMIWSASPGWATPGDRAGYDMTVGDLLTEIESGAGGLSGQPTVEADVRRMLGIAYFYMARYPEGAEQAEAAWRLDLEAQGPDHYDVAHDLEVLADNQGQYGWIDLARENYEEALATFRRVGAEPDTQLFFLATLSNYGLLELQTGRFERAEALFEEALERTRRDLGPGHPMEAVVVGNMASLEFSRRDLEAAEEHLHRSLEIWDDVPGRERFETGGFLSYLARVETERGNFERADSLLERAAAILERTPPTIHSLRVGVRLSEALLAERRGDLARAEAAASDALEALDGVILKDHVHRATVETVLGRILVAAGRAAEAEPLLRHALEVRERYLPDDSWWTAETRAALGEAMVAAGRPEEGRGLVRAAIPALARVLGSDHPLTARAEGVARAGPLGAGSQGASASRTAP